MVVLRDNIYVDLCEIEDKRFSVTLGRDGGTVRPLENRRNFSFSVLQSRVAACWLVRIVDVMVNKRSSCLRLLKVAQGEDMIILIPEGSQRNR